MSPMMMHSMYDNSVFNSLAGLAAGPFVTIFSLHRPLSSNHPHAGTDPDFLRTALRVLAGRGFRFMSLGSILKAARANRAIPPKTVCFTLDDGYADQARDLIPVFNEADANATVFVITDFLDRKDWPWDEKITYIIDTTRLASLEGVDQFFPCPTLKLENGAEKTLARRHLQTAAKELPAEEISGFLAWLSDKCEVEIPSEPPFGYEPMSWDQARELESQGACFAPHSCNHYITSRISRDEARRQFCSSWGRLEEELERPEKIYCYPTGRPQDFDEGHERLLHESGYLGAVSFISKPLMLRQFMEQRYRLPRIAFPNTAAKVLRYASWCEAIRSFRG